MNFFIAAWVDYTKWKLQFKPENRWCRPWPMKRFAFVIVRYDVRLLRSSTHEVMRQKLMESWSFPLRHPFFFIRRVSCWEFSLKSSQGELCQLALDFTFDLNGREIAKKYSKLVRNFVELEKLGTSRCSDVYRMQIELIHFARYGTGFFIA